MAFEDRCSPQSAPSPPGIAQSPHKTGIVLVKNGSDSHNSSHNNSYTIEQEMSMMIPATATTIPSTTLVHEKPSTPITTSDVECSTSPSLQQQSQNGISIKQEKSTSPQQHTAPISFSITNILSDSFGHTKLQTANQVNNNNSKNVISEKKSGVLFRPYDDDEDDRESGVTLAKKSKLSSSLENHHQSDFEDDDEHHYNGNGDSLKQNEHKSVTDNGDDIDEEIDVTDERTKYHQNAAIDFSNGRQYYNLSPSVKDFYNQERLIQANSAVQQQQQKQLLHHYQAAAAVAAAQQSLHRVGAHNLIDSSSLEAHHRSLLYPDFYQNQQQQALAKSIYPKLHEDILNSSKQYQQYYQTTRLLTDSVLAKYPPLGNLCKTVSQIGQPTPPIPQPPTTDAAKLAPSPIRSAESMSHKKSAKRSLDGGVSGSSGTANDSISATVSTSSSSSSSTASNEISAVKSTHQSHSLDSGMESSDDTKSETGSTKDENGSQLWPAWIYCTRYSDRPSSGKHTILVAEINWLRDSFQKILRFFFEEKKTSERKKH